MMKIMIGVSSSVDRSGGISSYAQELAIKLSSLNYQIHYVSPPAKSSKWFDKYGIKFISSSEVGSQVQQCEFLYAYIYENKIDVIINNDNSMLQSLAPLVPCPFISICHMSSRAVGALTLINSEWCDYIVAISYDMYEVVRKKSKLEPFKIPVIYNGVEPVENKSRENSCYGEKFVKPLACVFSGSYSSYKGADLFVNFLVSDLVPSNTEYYWFGDVPGRVKKKIKNLPHLKHIGRVSRSEYIDTVSRSDVLLLPSRSEGCPMALLEAMNYGLVPVVANGHGAMRHIITHGVDGFVCSLRNWSSDSSAVLSRLEKNRQLVKYYGDAASVTCKERFTIQKTADHLLRLSKKPTVNRDKMPNRVIVYRWHRPTGEARASGRATFLDRLSYRAGILRTEGVLRV